MKKALGVSLGKGVMELGAVASRLTGVTPLRAARVSLPAGPDERAAAVTGQLKQWQADFTPEGVVVGVPLQQFSHHLIDMPAMSKADTRRALAFDLEKYLPLPVEEYVYDFITLPGEKGMQKVLVLSLRRSVVDGLSRLLRESGLRLLAVRSSTIEVFCSLVGPPGTGLVIIATDEAYEVAGVRDSLPVFLKVFPRSADLVAEVERLSAIYAGGISCTGDMDHVTVARLKGRKTEVPVGHLLASSAVRRSRLSLNFMPPELVPPAKDLYPYLIGGLAAAALIFYLATGFTAYLKERATLRGIENRISELKGRAAGVLEARRKLEALGGARKAVVEFRARSAVATRALRDITDVLPKDAWLISFSVDDKGAVELEGMAARTSSVISALEKSALFKNIAFSAPIISRDGSERFALKLEVKTP